LEEPEPPPKPLAKLVSVAMPLEDAEEIWAELEYGDYMGVFRIEDA